MASIFRHQLTTIPELGEEEREEGFDEMVTRTEEDPTTDFGHKDSFFLQVQKETPRVIQDTIPLKKV